MITNSVLDNSDYSLYGNCTRPMAKSPCLVCDKGFLQLQRGPGRKVAGVVLPADFVLPQCDSQKCKQIWVPGEQQEELDSILAGKRKKPDLPPW